MHWPGKKLREKSLRTVMEQIHYEDENTRYICLGPVNKVRFHSLAVLLLIVYPYIFLCDQFVICIS